MHRSRIALYAAILILFFLEVTLFDKLRIFGMRPEILLIATVFFGFHFGIIYGIEAGIVSGILKDIFSISTFGINTFSFLFIGFLSGYLKDKLFKENFVTQFLFSCLSVYLVWAISLLGWGENYSPYVKPVLCKGLYTGIFAPILFLILTKIFGPKEA